ncbi:sulfate permease, SulP family [Thalassolituus maritimus]|uniref:Sulfate permease, SulP family n=1 Tax=Thalassolituus maritimus TaxID=484498 RepID=A0A1N7P9P8_9GAMM|nr:SulP family inorganic anion transporter [Thalassolituus maritimus]SIT07270.1 sulfate permease, SulP family [Thalassolituus maritimus]
MKIRNTLYPLPRQGLLPDFIAGLVVAVMLVPQALAYAFLAGLPPEAGLFSSLLPLLAYAVLGSSPTLAVGPVAIISLMTLSSLHGIVSPDASDYHAYATLLAGMTGAWLFIFFAIGLGSWTSFISHSVISGFTSAAAIVIILSQLKYFTGLDMPRGGSGWSPAAFTVEHWREIALWPLITALAGVALLTFWQKFIPAVTARFALPDALRTLANRAGPLVLVTTGTLLVLVLNPPLATVGAVPSGFPALSLPAITDLDWQALVIPSGVLALIIFLESLSISNTMAREQTNRIRPNQELLALGTANVAAAISHAMPVAGGFGRSMVMQSAGALSQWAAIFTFVFMTLVCLIAGSWFQHLPHAALGALIVVATWPLFRWRDGLNAWNFQRSDGIVWLTTFALVIVVDAESGIIAGVAVSLVIYLRRTSQPHIAEIGRLPRTQQFRNVLRHSVETIPGVTLIRVDENLYFANSDYLIDYVLERVARRPDIRHVVLVGTAINHIDYCGLEALELLNSRLKERSVVLHLAEFKGPVMDQLSKTHLAEKIRPGQVFFTISDAMSALGHSIPEKSNDNYII